MIIDCHGHVSAPAELWAYKAALLVASRLARPRQASRSPTTRSARAANKKEMAPPAISTC